MAVAAISIDNPLHAMGMKEMVGAGFPVLSDENKKVVQRYGVYNLHGDGVAAPATFVLLPDKSIAWKHIGKDIVDRPSPDQILAEVDRLIR